MHVGTVNANLTVPLKSNLPPSRKTFVSWDKMRALKNSNYGYLNISQDVNTLL